jgi:hypothetical protein
LKVTIETSGKVIWIDGRSATLDQLENLLRDVACVVGLQIARTGQLGSFQQQRRA